MSNKKQIRIIGYKVNGINRIVNDIAEIDYFVTNKGYINRLFNIELDKILNKNDKVELIFAKE